MRSKAFSRNLAAALTCAGLAAVTLAGGIAPALAAPAVCIDTRMIKDSKAEKGGGALLFTMRDGTHYRNQLTSKCPDLDYNGYVWTIRNPDNTVCDNQETIRVIQSGEICQLGKFTKVPAPMKAPG